MRIRYAATITLQKTDEGYRAIMAGNVRYPEREWRVLTRQMNRAEYVALSTPQ